MDYGYKLQEGLSRIQPYTWKIAFIFAFLALLVDGADLMLLSYSLNSIKADFGLSSVQAGMLGSFTLAGMAVGGIFGGWACDKFGRVRIVVISILIFSLLTCGLGFTQSFLQFGILRFFASLGLGSLYIACNTLMAEYVPTRFRTTVLGTLQAGWTVGYIVATLLAGWIIPDHGWRMLFLLRLFQSLLLCSCIFLYPNQKHGKSLDFNNQLWIKTHRKLRHLSLFSKISETVICLSYGR